MIAGLLSGVWLFIKNHLKIGAARAEERQPNLKICARIS